MSYEYQGVTIPADYGSRLGNANQAAVDAFLSIFKRKPTGAELGATAQYFSPSTDFVLPDTVGGAAAVAALYNTERTGGYSASGDPTILDVTPTIAPGNPPLNTVSTLSPVPGDGASSLPMPATANAYQPAYIAPAGGVPAPATVSIPQTNTSFFIFAALAVGGFMVLRKWI
jgi:hypothetical protein